MPGEHIFFAREIFRPHQPRGHAAGNSIGAQERRKQHRVFGAVAGFCLRSLAGARKRAAQVLICNMVGYRASKRFRLDQNVKQKIRIARIIDGRSVVVVFHIPAHIRQRAFFQGNYRGIFPINHGR